MISALLPRRQRPKTSNNEPLSDGADGCEYRQAAAPVAEAVIRSVELIVQPDAHDVVGAVALGPAKRIINDANVGRAITLLLGHA